MIYKIQEKMTGTVKYKSLRKTATLSGHRACKQHFNLLGYLFSPAPVTPENSLSLAVTYSESRQTASAASRMCAEHLNRIWEERQRY